MRPLAHIDFETYSELDVRKVGSCKYAEHPSTEVLCLGWAIGNEDPELWVPGDRPPRRLFEHVKRGGLVYAWNAEFEIAIWADQCVQRMGWPGVSFRQWRDAEAVALSFAFPASLEGAGEALGLDVVKDPRGKHLVRKLSKPRRPSKHDPSTRWTPEKVPEDFAGLYSYCRQDVRSERAVLHALPRIDLPPRELTFWRITAEMNTRGWTVDIESARRMLWLLEENEVRGLAELRKTTGGKVTTVNQRDRALEWFRSQGVKLPNFTADTVKKTLEKKRLPEKVRRVLEIRQELGKSSTKKYEAMISRACADRTIKNNLLYHGASTGRDAGRGVQIQNLVRATFAKTEEEIEAALETLRIEEPLTLIEAMYCPAPHYASQMIRPMLTAAPGKVIYCGDYSSIENRITVWLAGSEYGMQIFRDGLDQYKMAAVKHYGVDYDDVTTPQRDHMKRAVLLSCFGGGWKSYQAQAIQYGVDGSQASEEVARETIRAYREDLYPEVPAMWYDLEKAAQEAVLSKTSTSVVTKYAVIHFRIRDDFLFMVLPSGRKLAYYQPEVRSIRAWWGQKKPTLVHMGIGRNHQWTELKLIPGRIFENAVQATARDVLREGVIATTRAGYELVGRVHDENVSQREKGTGNLEEFLGLMCPDLPWLKGIPIEADGWVGHRYRK